MFTIYRRLLPRTNNTTIRDQDMRDQNANGFWSAIHFTINTNDRLIKIFTLGLRRPAFLVDTTGPLDPEEVDDLLLRKFYKKKGMMAQSITPSSRTTSLARPTGKKTTKRSIESIMPPYFLLFCVQHTWGRATTPSGASPRSASGNSCGTPGRICRTAAAHRPGRRTGIARRSRRCSSRAPPPRAWRWPVSPRSPCTFWAAAETGAPSAATTRWTVWISWPAPFLPCGVGLR